MIRLILLAVSAFLISDSVADDFVLEPDDFAVGTILNNAIPEATLTAIDPNGVVRGDVVSRNGEGFASTGSRIFGHTVNYAGGLFWAAESVLLRCEFISLTSTVTLDIIPDDTNDPAFLRAYGCAGELLDEATSTAGPTGVPVTLTVHSPSGNIKYIIASGIPGDTVALDFLRFTVTPRA